MVMKNLQVTYVWEVRCKQLVVWRKYVVAPRFNLPAR